jgi:hypothetical protein
MSEAVDMADSDREAPGTMPWRAARRSREARVKYWRTFAVSLFFIALLGTGLYTGVVLIIGSDSGQDASDRAWAANRTARISHQLLDGTFCRTMVYDNKSARTIEDKVTRCDTNGRHITDYSPGKSRAEFNWGRK